MIMIVVCHLGTALDSSVVGQAFQVGVQLFLFISGYLYSNVKIENMKKWANKRFLRICIPCYIFISYALLISFILNKTTDYRMLILAMLNLQGYHHVFAFLPYLEQISGTAHLWFITVIFICYVVMTTIKSIETKIALTKNFVMVFLLLFLIITFCLGILGIRLDYILIYMLGYFYARYRDEKLSLSKVKVFLCIIVALVLRVLMKQYCDVHGDNNLYLYVVIPFSYNLLAFGLFKLFELLNVYISSFWNISLLRTPVLYLDALSFYVYIVHYQFIDSPFSLIHLTNNLVLNISLIIALTITSAIVLKYISEKAIKLINGDCTD